MKKMNVLFAFASLVLVGVSAQAQPIGPAGCGLGNAVMGTKNQVFAATTNGTSGNQTFGITSGTLNCGTGAFNNTAQVLNFIDANKVALSKEAARGQGETIAGLAHVVGCNDAQVLGNSMKQNFETLFPNADVSPAHVTGQLQQMIKNNAQLASVCSVG